MAAAAVVQTYRMLWASQVALVVNNLLANAGDIKTQVRFLGWEDPVEESMATHYHVFTWRIRWIKAIVHGVAKSLTLLK